MKKLTTLLLATATGIAMTSGAFAASHSKRGSDGEVKILYWQAPSILNPYLSGGTKDLESSSLIIEPLARYNETGAMVPWLAESVPTVENGGVSKDLKSITWKLKSGLKWSNGEPVTSDDVIFSWKYCTADGGGCAQIEKYKDVADVMRIDDLTVKVVFSASKPFPYGPFVGAQSPIINAKQFANCLGAKAQECTEANFNPIGTGPFVVDSFKTNDVIQLSANPNYRDPNKPAFAKVTFKGGGSATDAGRAVLETGEFDYAWNLQLAPEVIKKMVAAGKGVVESGFGTLVERIMVNQTNPSADLGDERGTAKHPHPFLTDINVRKALSMAIDRNLLTEIGYGSAGRPTCNVLPAPAIYASTANDACLKQDIAGAKKLLDDAGWKAGADGVRAKGGVKLNIGYQTSTNAVRQDFQALIKQWWKEIGVSTELRNIDGSVFFGGNVSSPDTFQKFFTDVEMYANNFDGTDPEAYMSNWACAQAPTPKNQWQGNNMQRYCDPEYDALVAKMATTGDINDRAKMAKAMNDKLMQSYTIIPLVDRGRVSGRANSLGGVILNTWDSELWNAADWHRVK